MFVPGFCILAETVVVIVVDKLHSQGGVGSVRLSGKVPLAGVGPEPHNFGYGWYAARMTMSNSFEDQAAGQSEIQSMYTDS